MIDLTNPGKLSKEPDGYRVYFERVLPFGASTVWDAITNPKKMALWFMEMEMDFKEGGKMTIRFPPPDNSESTGTIVRIVKEKTFEYYWEEELVTWELEAMGSNQCKLKLTHSKVDDRWAKSVPAGWHLMLDAIETILQGKEVSTATGSKRQEDLKAAYAAIYQSI